LMEDAEDVRVVVVTGRGKQFCVGADSRALEGHAERGAYDAGTDSSTLARPGYGVSNEFDCDFAYVELSSLTHCLFKQLAWPQRTNMHASSFGQPDCRRVVELHARNNFSPGLFKR
jgi:hypothetical protein